MNEQDRRTILKSAGLGVGAGLLSGILTPANAASEGDIWSAEYWAKKSRQRRWRDWLVTSAAVNRTPTIAGAKTHQKL